MASTKRKPATRTRKSPRASRRQPAGAEPPLQQGLLEMATIGAQSFLWLAMVVAIIAGLAGAAYGIWSLRPVPDYSSARIRVSSPFGVTFRVENTSAWFPLSHLKISCALANPEMAVEVEGLPPHLEPGAVATFHCPFRATSDDLDAALRSELYFRSEYDAPVLNSFRLTDIRGPFILDTKTLPPRWTAKPAKD